MTDTEPDYEAYYQENWAELYEDEDGNLNKDMIMRELYDYGQILEKFTKFIYFTTGGRADNPQIVLEDLQTFAIITATDTAKAAIVQELEMLEDLILMDETDYNLLIDAIHGHKEQLKHGVPVE